ncbi:MAG: response regulator [Patescibacteria group bacterium]
MAAKVLVVEDEPSIADLIGMMLASQGYDVVTRNNATDALLELAKGASFHAIITDYGLPEMDGRDFIETMRKRGLRVPTVLVTGRGDLTFDEVSAMGVAAVIIKPFLRKELLSAVDHALSIRA